MLPLVKEDISSLVSSCLYRLFNFSRFLRDNKHKKQGAIRRIVVLPSECFKDIPWVFSRAGNDTPTSWQAFLAIISWCRRSFSLALKIYQELVPRRFFLSYFWTTIMLLCASNVLFITYSEALILASVNLYVHSECLSLTRTSVRAQIKLIGLHENCVKKILYHFYQQLWR